MELTWADAEEIAEKLHERFPDKDPLDVRYGDLWHWVSEIPEFTDDPDTSDEGKLEAIQMAWLDRRH